jgi:hypothetical protein
MSDEDDDYCVEEETDVVSGPICEVCGKPSDSIYECYVKRELRGRFEMVKIYLCARHFVEQMEQDALPPPPEEDSGEAERWKKFMEGIEPPDNENENDDDENDDNWGSHNT